jgi:hypothetical protein
VYSRNAEKVAALVVPGIVRRSAMPSTPKD